jgi:hypothetical protein
MAIQAIRQLRLTPSAPSSSIHALPQSIPKVLWDHAFLDALERVIKGKAQPASSPRPDDKEKGVA